MVKLKFQLSLFNNKIWLGTSLGLNWFCYYSECDKWVSHGFEIVYYLWHLTKWADYFHKFHVILLLKWYFFFTKRCITFSDSATISSWSKEKNELTPFQTNFSLSNKIMKQSLLNFKTLNSDFLRSWIHKSVFLFWKFVYKGITWAVVVAQLAEWSLLTPEVRGLNPDIRKFYIEHCLLSTVQICKPLKGKILLTSLYRHCVNRLPTLLTNGPIDCVGHEAPWWTDRSLDLSPSKTQWCDRYLYSESSEDITSFVRSDHFT